MASLTHRYMVSSAESEVRSVIHLESSFDGQFISSHLQIPVPFEGVRYKEIQSL